MRVLGGLLLLLVCLASDAPSLADEPPPPVFDYDAAERALGAGALPEGGARALLEQASAALGRRAELASEAAARGSLSFAATAQAKVKNWLGLEASAGVGTSGGQVGLGHRLLRFKGSSDPSERSVTSQIEVAYGVDADGALLKHAWSVKLEYDDNRTYLRALGLDVRNVPGMSTVIETMDRLAGREAEAVVQGGGGEREGVRAAMEAAGRELKRLVPDMFHAAAEFDRVTIGEGTIVESPSGDVSVSHMRQELLERGQQEGEGQRWSEVALGVDIDKGLRAGKAAEVSGGLALELKRTYGDAPPGARASDPAALDALGRGDVEGLAERARERLTPVLEPERMQRAFEALDAKGEAAPTGSDRIVAVREEDVGGVRLQYDPQMLATAIAPASAARLLDRVLAQVDAGAEGFVVASDASGLELRIVSLAGILRDGAPTVGAITCLRGCVLDGDDVLLLGVAEPGAPPPATDVLAVAARNVWEAGTFPFVSLDPDPADLKGPQRVRVGGILESTRATQFVRVMLDADYAMKRIDMGLDPVDVPGFRSFAALLRETPTTREILARAWLSPMRSTVADVWTWAAGPRQAVLFDTRVQVLSESMRRTREGLLGGGDVDPLSAAAADGFTCHYEGIARRHPVFAELRGLLSAVKLCAILRARGAKPEALARAAAHRPAEVEIPTSYAGLHVEDGAIRISGGALSRVRLSKGAFREAPELGAVLGAQAGAVLDASFPTTVGLSAEQAFEATGEVHANRGVKAFQEGDYEACERSMDAALERDDELHEARLLRAVCRLARGEAEGARADVDAVLPHVPEAIGFRAMLHTLLGRDAEGAADLRAAARAFPADDDVRAWRAQAHLYRFELAQAEALVLELLRRTPTDPGAQALWDMLGLLHRLGPAEAARRVRHLRGVPLMVTETLAEGTQALQGMDAHGALAALTRSLQLMDRLGAHPDVEALHLRERAEMFWVLASRFVARLESAPPTAETAEMVERLLARHPDWPSLRLLAALALPPDADDQVTKHLDAALSLPRAGDPLLADLTVQLGTQRMEAWVAFSLLFQANQRQADVAVQQDLMQRTAKALGDAPEAALVTLLAEGGRQDPLVALPELRKRLLAFATPLPSDPVTVLVVGFAFASCMSIAEKLEEPFERRAEVARWFLAASDVADLPGPAWTMASMFRMAAVQVLSEELTHRRASDPELRKIRLALSNRRAPLPQLRARVAAWDASHIERATEGLGPFLATWMRTMRRDPVLEELHASAARLVGEVPDGPERQAYERELAAWRAELDLALGVAALADPERERPPTPQELEAAREGFMTRLLDVVKQARKPADVHMLGALVRLLSAGLPKFAAHDPAGAAQMQQALLRMASGLSGEDLRLVPRDWSAFGTRPR